MYVFLSFPCSVDAFNGALRRELVATPIRVTQVLPGMTETVIHSYELNCTITTGMVETGEWDETCTL